MKERTYWKPQIYQQKSRKESDTSKYSHYYIRRQHNIPYFRTLWGGNYPNLMNMMDPKHEKILLLFLQNSQNNPTEPMEDGETMMKA